MTGFRGSGAKAFATRANKTFEKTLASLDKETIPPEFQNDFEDYLPSDDHGSSTQRDKVDRSSDLFRSESDDDDSDSLDESDGEYQPENARHVSNQKSDIKYTSSLANVPVRNLDRDEEPDDMGEEQEDVEIDDGKSKRAKKPAGGKKVTAKPVGSVRYDEDGLEWFDPNQSVWRPAVYHQDIRKRLIADAARLGQYRHELARGKDKLDVTAFHPAYARNGPERKHWPKILFQYAPTMADFLHSKPQIWQLHDGRVVIDCNNDAMNDFPEIPVTLARNADSWLLLTCMRLNNHITIQDFRGRMPGELKTNMADPLGRNRISMNMTRFRKYGCCLTWNSIRNVDTQREYLDKKLPRRCIRLNSTESFRKLHPWEVAESELQDAGRFLKRTRSSFKDVSKAKSRQVYKRKRAEFDQLKRSFDLTKPSGQDDYDAEDEEFAKKQKAGFQSDGKAAEIALDMVKPGRRKRPGQGTLSAKDILVLPDDSRADAKTEERKMCPRRHKEYAGFLTRAPSNIKEAQLLYDLLRPSRIHYEMNTRQVAPETFGDECYKCQSSDLQNSVIDWHELHPVFEAMEPAKLIGLQYVVNGELYWNTDWNEAWFGLQPMVNPDDIF
ncbi:MAG: hypothetical protein Q9178_006734 [Gyalolechia marmorata]